MKKLKLYAIFTMIFSIALVAIALLIANGKGLFTSNPPTIDFLRSINPGALCAEQYARWEAKGKDVLYDGKLGNASIEVILIVLLLPIWSIYYLNRLTEPTTKVSNNHRTYKNIYKSALRAAIAISIFFCTIEIARWIFSSVLITNILGLDKSVFTWTSWCVAPWQVSVADITSKSLSFFVYFIPIGLLWSFTSREAVPALDLKHADKKCGIADVVHTLRELKHYLSSTVALMTVFWGAYILNEDIGKDGLLYLTAPIITLGLIAAVVYRIKKYCEVIYHDYQREADVKKRALAKDKGVAVKDLGHEDLIKIPENPVEGFYGPNANLLLKDLSLPVFISVLSVLFTDFL